MNHQDIVDRRESLGTEQSRALQTENARIQRELASLQELCGGMGHIYVHLKGTWNTMMPNRICAACGRDRRRGGSASDHTYRKNMNDIAQIPPQRSSLITKVATRFGVDPTKMMDTLKATAFKVKDATVTNEQMMALLIVADQYGLNPFTKEIYAFPDKGGIVPVVGIDGWARIINEHPSFDGMDFTMPEDGSSCTCQIYRKDRGHSISVTEYMAECKRGTQPWSSHPRRMLRHKAMIQCARMAFGFAGIYDRDEADRIAKGGTIDSDSGEIIDMPSATGIAAVRQAAAKKAKKAELAAEQANPQTGETTPPAGAEDSGKGEEGPSEPEPPKPASAATMSAFQSRIFKAGDGEAAAIALDEARGQVTAEQHQALTTTYRNQWQAAQGEGDGS